MIITTPRLILRASRPEDAQSFTEEKQKVWPELQKWMNWAAPGQETLAATHAFFESWKDYSLLGFCRVTDRFVVATGLNPVMDKEGEYETGYWVAQDFLGKGYATEATNAVIRFAFTQKSAKAIHIGYFEGNDKSRNVIEKLGFTPLGKKDEKHIRFSDGTMVGEYVCVMHDPQKLPPLDVRFQPA